MKQFAGNEWRVGSVWKNGRTRSQFQMFRLSCPYPKCLSKIFIRQVIAKKQLQQATQQNSSSSPVNSSAAAAAAIAAQEIQHQNQIKQSETNLSAQYQVMIAQQQVCRIGKDWFNFLFRFAFLSIIFFPPPE